MTSTVFLTDAYKFAMAEAGWPLRRETFYYSHRRGGPQVLPVDVRKFILGILPEPTPDDFKHLRERGYDLGPGAKSALVSREVGIVTMPQGNVFYPREPIFCVTGPSALVSWLEPQVIQLNYRIQVATMAKFKPWELPEAVGSVTCEAQRQIVLETLDWAKVAAPKIVVDPEGYYNRVLATARKLAECVEDPSVQLFEVGLRASTCAEQHRIALSACEQAGIRKTSSGVLLPGMKMVGTTGHEHVQRCGSDKEAVWQMHDRLPGPISCLPDTWDTMTLGVPAAHDMMRYSNRKGHFIRYDSGDKVLQAEATILRAKHMAIHHGHIFEDGLDYDLTVRLEELRKAYGFAPSEWLYGYGGHLISGSMGSPLHRDRVAAVYKLSQTGPRPTMKFGNEVGRAKMSLPGVPVVFRRLSGSGPERLIGQRGEQIEGAGRYVDLTSFDEPFDELVEYADWNMSDATRRMIDQLSDEHRKKESY